VKRTDVNSLTSVSDEREIDLVHNEMKLPYLVFNFVVKSDNGACILNNAYVQREVKVE